ncbi:ribonuclease P protein component [Chitinophaga costaii]|uniref:ribonuclease P protein component n=1 Tax=Chitinophaga costaii TaxID=1335309 RepID=UPI0021CD2E1F|nr:ribonuclease P protein component [Chitinophaga costaii]
MKTYSFTREERLKSKKLIETLFREGKAFSVFPYRVIYLVGGLPTPAFPVQVGFTAPSRHFPHAVDRNRIKRLGRECWRLQKAPLYAHLRERQLQVSVFFLYTDKQITDYETLYKKMGQAIARLDKVLLEA